ncbi:MAG: sodium-independent anion transporter, partial [Paracoccaceae bacterium]
MKRAIFGSFANLTMLDLGLSNEKNLNAGRIGTELLSGLTVALALVPEAVAFAFVAGVHPL